MACIIRNFHPTAREWVFVYMDESAIGANVFRGNGVLVCNLYYYETRFQYCCSSVMSWRPSHHLHGMFYCDIEIGMTYDIDQRWGQTTCVASPHPFCLPKVKKGSLEQKSQKGINQLKTTWYHRRFHHVMLVFNLSVLAYFVRLRGAGHRGSDYITEYIHLYI